MAEWSEERVEQLRKLWAEGFSTSQIARRMGGLTRNAVIGKCYRIGLRDADRRPALPARVAMKPLSGAQRRKAEKGVTVIRVAKTTAPQWKPPLVFGVTRPSRPVVSPAPQVDTSSARPWIERATGQCAYPVDGEGAETRSCCAPALARGYCAGHFARVYQVGTANARPVNNRQAYAGTASAHEEAAEPDLLDLVA